MNKLSIIVISTFILSNCTWVNENSQGKTIAIVNSNQINNCQKIGNISAEVKHKVGFIKRNEKKVLKELQVLARNEAVKLGANTIVANGEPSEGKQSYQAFVCP
jgi:hypothetical protein